MLTGAANYPDRHLLMLTSARQANNMVRRQRLMPIVPSRMFLSTFAGCCHASPLPSLDRSLSVDLFSVCWPKSRAEKRSGQVEPKPKHGFWRRLIDGAGRRTLHRTQRRDVHRARRRTLHRTRRRDVHRARRRTLHRTWRRVVHRAWRWPLYWTWRRSFHRARGRSFDRAGRRNVDRSNCLYE